MGRTLAAGSSAHCGVVPPPPGITPNCTNPTTQTSNNIALHTTMLFLATISLLIRLYTRFCILRSSGLDDYLCILGCALLIAYSGIVLACGNIYLGHHIYEIPKSDFINGHKLEVIVEWIYCFTSPTLKLAALWFYRGIFASQTRVHYIINGGIVFNVVAYTALFFISLLTCMPFERRFDPFAEGNCLPTGVSAYLSGAINVVTDAFVVFLPIPIIGRLNMAPARKARAMAVFGLGIIVLALSATRLAKTPLVFKEKDPTWELSHFAIYSILELYFGLMCNCFLASPSFLDRFGPSIVSRIRSYATTFRLSSSEEIQDTPVDNAAYGRRSHVPRKTTMPSRPFVTQVERAPKKHSNIVLEQKESTMPLKPFGSIQEV